MFRIVRSNISGSSVPYALPFPVVKSGVIRSYTPSPLSRFEVYSGATMNQKAQLLAAAGLEICGLKNTQDFWKQRRLELSEQMKIPESIRDDYWELGNLAIAVHMLWDRRYPQHVENLYEMTIVENSFQLCSWMMQMKSYADEPKMAPFQWLAGQIPLGDLSGDYKACCELVGKYIGGKKVFILEDGSGNGWYLTKWMNQIVNQSDQQEQNIRAVGGDLCGQLVSIGQMLTGVMQLTKRLKFVPSHVMYRKSPREIDNSQSDVYITLACRVVPVFKESQIRRYFEKVSKEMKKGDIWCGSIAMPGRGEFYMRNATGKGGIERVKTSFGGETFIHTPQGLNEGTAAWLAKRAREYSLKMEYSTGDHKQIILNTYVPQDKFKDLAWGYDLELIDSVEARCPKTDYFCVVLRKI